MARLLQTLFFNPRRAGNNTNEGLVSALKISGTFQNPKIEEAMLAIPRHMFVTEDLLAEAYHDNPLRFSRMGFNISAPHMHAMCLENMNIQPGDIILDIGSGSGLLTALAAYLTGPQGCVYGFDLHDHIIEFSRNNVTKLVEQYPQLCLNIRWVKRNCFLPVAQPILYDKIHVGCCCPETKLQYLFDMLKPGGTLVTPYGDQLIRATKNEDGTITTKSLADVRYSDLTLPSDAEVKEAEKEIKIARANSIIVLHETIHENIGRLFLNQYLSDVVFLVEGNSLIAHKLIVYLSSKPLAQLCEGTKEVAIPDCTHAAMHALLYLFYNGNWPELSPEVQEEALALAKKYEAVLPADNVPFEERLGQLVGSSQLSDITFNVAGEQIPAHKLILRVRSEYFNGMFSSGLRESRNSVIDIQECTPVIFIEVLRFIYTGDCKFTEATCVGILEQANLLGLDRLTTMCEQYWRDTISISNAATILELSDHYNAYQLKQYALEFIFTHVKDVVKTAAWRDLDIDLVSMVLVAAVERSL